MSNVFKIDVQPADKKGFILLNPKVVAKDRHDPLLRKVQTSPCNNLGYANKDPRLFSAMRGSYMVLDKPPLDGSVKFSQIYDRNLRDYGKNFKSYNDINSGQYVYYIDKSTADAFIKPVFQTPAKVIGYDYANPMNNVSPYYDRIPQQNNFIEAVPKPDQCFKRDNLSFIEDSQYFREDLISKQLSKANRRKYSARHD